MRYRLEVRLTPADVGKRVVIRWRPGPDDSKQMTDVLGILEQADAGSFAVRTRDGTLVVIPAATRAEPHTPRAARISPPPRPSEPGRCHQRALSFFHVASAAVAVAVAVFDGD